MASELRVNTLKDASGNNSIATSVVFNGSAKAWLHKAADGASNPDSYNISSIDDDGTGQIGVTLTSAMSNAVYSIIASVVDADNSTVISTCEIRDNMATNSFDAHTAYGN